VKVTQSRNFVKSSVYRRGLRVLGNGLLTSEGDSGSVSAVWFNRLFTRSGLQPMEMVAYTNRLLDRWQDGFIRDVHQDMMSLTSEIVSKALFDVDITSEAEGVQVALDAVMDFNAQLSQYFQVGYPPSNLRYQRAIQQLDDCLSNYQSATSE